MAISQKLIKIIAFRLCHFEDIDAEIECHPLESDTRGRAAPPRPPVATPLLKPNGGMSATVAYRRGGGGCGPHRVSLSRGWHSIYGSTSSKWHKRNEIIFIRFWDITFYILLFLKKYIYYEQWRSYRGGEAARPGGHSLGGDTQSMDQYLWNDTNGA